MEQRFEGPSEEMSTEGVFVQPGKPWLVDVDVYLDDDVSDPPKFRVLSVLPSKNPGSDDPGFIFENRGRPGFELRFNLFDQTRKGYRFPEDKDDIVWSLKGNKCPTSQAHEVLVPDRREDDLTAIVKNDNPGKLGIGLGPFKFTINVTLDGKKPYLPLDPSGEDRNGPRQLLQRA